MSTPAVWSSASGSPGSPTLSPNDHLRLLVEFLRPLGPELARRWLGVLLLVPQDERGALVAEMERRATELYAPVKPLPTSRRRAKPLGTPSDPEVRIVYAALEKNGFVEHEEASYRASSHGSGKPQRESSPRRGRGA